MPPDSPSTMQSPAGPSAGIQRAIDTLQITYNQSKEYSERRRQQSVLVARAAERQQLQSVLTTYGPERRQNQTELEARAAEYRQKQSVLVTRVAERHFDSALGQCNWEAVANELDTPLIECLDLFDATISTIKPRSLIENYGGWSRMDMEALERFIADYYVDTSTVDWTLAGAYMNVDPLECQRVGQGIFNEPINKVGYRRIRELRDSGLSWNDIYQYFLQYPSVTSLRSRVCWFKDNLDEGAAERLTAEWTDAEREQMRDLIEQQVDSTATSELVDIIKRELPDRPLSDIRQFSYQHIHELKTGRMVVALMAQLRDLVAEYGEDWDYIGEELGILPSRAQHNWITYGEDVAQNLGAESHPFAPGQQKDALSWSRWAVADDEILLNIVDGSTLCAAAKWEQASKVLGRSVIACKCRLSGINRDHSCTQATYDSQSLVTSEVQRQRESSGIVDWSQVSQATGLGLRECLELSQYDVGKARWHYDPDSFSQSMAERMTDSVREHYPAPVPVNYRAVSNYMWVTVEDCIRIHDMLQGKFKLTEADYERAAALRAQGLTFNEVARHLSPTLTGRNVSDALRRYSLPKPVREPISVDELDEISRLVDEYAGKYTVAELIDKIRTQLNLGNRLNCHSTVSLRIAAHPHYQTKIRDIDYNDLASRIAEGQTTVKLAAKELDVPRPALASRMQNIGSKPFSSKWTEEEIRKLIDYVQGCVSKPDFVYFSKVLGTKSSTQCSRKTFELKRKGVLPYPPTI
ncbi:hypothetical protein GGH94_003050 [Coemansia aciculifera]|uniref:Uncharacterized protein n=1 Tax=Coemansia aciculifera TaxID=417176 RepID=A0A9W8II53_9FUNG|nr:hypothetical protein GGH94_003050 [Coemansia aciculifera]